MPRPPSSVVDSCTLPRSLDIRANLQWELSMAVHKRWQPNVRYRYRTQLAEVLQVVSPRYRGVTLVGEARQAKKKKDKREISPGVLVSRCVSPTFRESIFGDRLPTISFTATFDTSRPCFLWSIMVLGTRRLALVLSRASNTMAPRSVLCMGQLFLPTALLLPRFFLSSLLSFQGPGLFEGRIWGQPAPRLHHDAERAAESVLYRALGAVYDRSSPIRWQLLSLTVVCNF